MKKIIFSIIVSLLFLVGCDLEEQPFSFYAPENFYLNRQDAEAAIFAIYNAHQRDFVEYFYLTESPVSEVIVVGTAQDVIHRHQWEAGTASIFTVWSKCYVGINRANTAIDRIPQIPNLAESISKPLVAEARFLRALFYFDLVRLFGHVPLIENETKSVANVYVSNQNTGPKVWELIKSDLEYAEQNLPKSRPTSERGRATNMAATAYLAKMYLYRSTLAKFNPLSERWGVPGSTNEFQLAIDKSQKVINEGGYELLPVYGNVFDVEFNNERIFEIQYTAGMGQGQTFVQNVMPNGALANKITSFGISRTSKVFLDQWEPEDKRYSRNFLLEFVSSINGNTVKYPTNLADPYNGKYRITDGTANDNGMNITLMRYAEILLTHSEAANELGSGNPYLGLNQIRNRAGFELLSGLDQAELRDEIRKQRRFELTFEFNGVFDMQRWNTLELEATRKGVVPNQKNYLFPIPKREMDINPNLVQNPNY